MPLLRLQFAGQQSDWCWKAGTGDGIVRTYDTDCYYFVLPLGILIALFPELVLRIYTDNTDLIAGSVSSWLMLPLI